MSSIGNTYGSKTETYLGGFPAWYRVNGKEMSGGVLSALPSVGTVIPAGTLESLSSNGGTCTIVKTWVAAASALSSATSIKIKLASIYSLKPVVNEFIMVAPPTVSTAGQGAQITAVSADASDTNGLTYDVTLSVALGTALTTSSILVAANNATASATVLAVPTGLTGEDIPILTGTNYATVTSVYSGVIFEDRVAPVPACFKAVLPMIKFQKG